MGEKKLQSAHGLKSDSRAPQARIPACMYVLRILSGEKRKKENRAAPPVGGAA